MHLGPRRFRTPPPTVRLLSFSPALLSFLEDAYCPARYFPGRTLGKGPSVLVRLRSCHPNLFSCIEEVDCSSDALDRADYDCLEAMPALKSLRVRTADMSARSIARLAQLPGLERLVLIGAPSDRVPKPGVMRVVAQMTHLTQLLASHVIGRGADGTAALLPLTRLASLGIVGRVLRHEGAANVGKMHSLQQLVLVNCPLATSIRDDGAEVLTHGGAAGLTSLSGLRDLVIRDCYLGAEDAKHLAKLTNLTSLDVSKNWIGKGIASLQPLKVLRHFELYQNRIRFVDGGEVIVDEIDLSGLAAMPLTTLELSKNVLTGKCRVLGPLAPTLENLFVGFCQLGPQDAADIAKLRALTFLSINNNPLTDKGLAALAAGLVNLKHLYLHSTSISGASLELVTHLSALEVLGLQNDHLASGVRHLSALPKLWALVFVDVGLQPEQGPRGAGIRRSTDRRGDDLLLIR